MRVTEVIKSCGLMAGVEFASDEAAWRGTCAHATLHLLNKGTLDRDSVHAQVMPFVLAYEKFMADTGFKPEIFEREVSSIPLNLVGHLDVEGRVNGSRWIIDFKTGLSCRSVNRWVGYQLALYDFLLGPPFPRRRFALKLLSDATYNLIPFDDPKDLTVALSCVNVVNAQKETKSCK